MLELTILGNVEIKRDGVPIPRFRSQTEIALLVFLAHTGQTHSREMIADLLWDARTTKQSLSNLRTVLTRLRKRTGDALIVTRKTVAIDRAVHEQTDSVRFAALLGDASRLEEGLGLYGGELMGGFYLPDAPRFNDWLTIEQERLRQLAARGYRQLATMQERRGAYAAGIETARRWVALNTLDEGAQQQLMRLLALNGQSADSLQSFEAYRKLLDTELGIAPTSATMQLIESIERGSLRAVKHNLPRTRTPIFGRISQLAQLKSYLLDPNHPLVSILGVGGIGKTTLAMAVARQLVSENGHTFSDGIWFVSLAEVEETAVELVKTRVAAIMGQALELHFHSESDLWSQLLAQLATKHALLILDNIEQFAVVAADLIDELLAAARNVHLLITSRTTLALGQGVVITLAGLDIPANLADAAQNESVQLFAASAARSPAPFDLAKNLTEVVAICQFVRGMPLAIELAAASLIRLSLHEVLPALQNNLSLLNTTHTALPARQRTLQAVFDHTWQLLDRREQAVLAQLAVFRGGFVRKSAETILENDSTTLYSLQHHALLKRDQTSRFQIHPLLRQLAQDKLPDPTPTLARHAAHFTALFGAYTNDLMYGTGRAALQILTPEQANLRAAWHYAVDAEQWQMIAQCLDSVHHFYKRTGLLSERADLIDRAIGRLEASAHTENALLSRLLTVQAWGYVKSADFANGMKSAERAIALSLDQASAEIEAQARLVLAQLHSMQVNYTEASDQYQKVIALAESVDNPQLKADGLRGFGSQFLFQPDPQPAYEPLHRALLHCQKHAYKVGELETEILLASLAHAQDNFSLSEEHFRQALSLSRQLGDIVEEAEVLGSIGVVVAAQGDLERAKQLYMEALATFQRINIPESELWMLSQLGLNDIQLGDYQSAEKYLTAALAIAERIDDRFWQARLNTLLGRAWTESGQSEKALAVLAKASDIAAEVGHPRLPTMIMEEWGLALLANQDHSAAEQMLQQAHDSWQAVGSPFETLPSLAALAFIAYRLGKTDVAAARADALWQSWQEHPTWAEQSNLKLYALLGTVWEGLGDDRAATVWAKARQLLQQRSEKITTPASRKMFINNIPAHQSIMMYRDN